MRPFKFLLLALGFAGAVTSACAQLVHLTFSDLNRPFLWQADSASVPWHMTTGKLRTFEIYYDPATATVESGEPGRPESYPDYIYSFSDPTRNFWRFHVTEPEQSALFTVTGPLGALYQNISWDGEGSQELAFTYMDGLNSAFDLRIYLSGTKEPVPPFEFREVRLNYLSVDSSFVDIPHMGLGSVSDGEFVSAEAAIVPFVDFSPVPEPSTYAMGGAAVLALSVLSRRFRRIRSVI